MQVGLQGAAGAGTDDPPHARLAHRPDVGAEVDLVRRELVLVAVARHEGNLLAVDLPHADRRRRRAVRGLEAHLLNLVEELVEARAAEDADHWAAWTTE